MTDRTVSPAVAAAAVSTRTEAEARATLSKPATRTEAVTDPKALAKKIARKAATMPKPDHDVMIRLIRQHFNEDAQRILTFTRWKDGIDIQYPTAAIELFYESVRKETIEACAKLVDTFTGATHPDTAKSISRILRDNM